MANAVPEGGSRGADPSWQARPQKPVVAVVDDDHGVLDLLEDLLESAGYGGRLFASAKQFLDPAIAEVDCVISDIGMLGADGFALQQIIRDCRPSLPVILITGRHEFATAEHEAARGGRLLFEKPFDMREIARGYCLRIASIERQAVTAVRDLTGKHYMRRPQPCRNDAITDRVAVSP